jgi:hypothetical protein
MFVRSMFWCGSSLHAESQICSNRIWISGTTTYINFMRDDDYDKIQDNYRQNYDRLVQVKRAYDPGNLFHINQNIAP